MTCTCPVPYGRTSDRRKWPHLAGCPESDTSKRHERGHAKRDNARWHEADRIVVEDPDAVRRHLQDARNSLAYVMGALDDPDDGEPNEAHEDVYSAVAWIDHAAHIVKGVMLHADPCGDLRDPEENEWDTGYVIVPTG